MPHNAICLPSPPTHQSPRTRAPPPAGDTSPPGSPAPLPPRRTATALARTIHRHHGATPTRPNETPHPATAPAAPPGTALGRPARGRPSGGSATGQQPHRGRRRAPRRRQGDFRRPVSPDLRNRQRERCRRRRRPCEEPRPSPGPPPASRRQYCPAPTQPPSFPPHRACPDDPLPPPFPPCPHRGLPVQSRPTSPKPVPLSPGPPLPPTRFFPAHDPSSAKRKRRPRAT